MRGFALSDITLPVDQVTTIPFLLEGDTVEYYHSLTNVVQDDWFQLMRVLGQCFDYISHEPVYLSRMFTLRQSEFPRHAEYLKEFHTCVMKSKVNTSDLQMGYLVSSQFVAGLSNDAVCRQNIFDLCSNGVLEDHSASISWWSLSQKPTWRPVINWKRYRMRPEQQQKPQVLLS